MNDYLILIKIYLIMILFNIVMNLMIIVYFMEFFNSIINDGYLSLELLRINHLKHVYDVILYLFILIILLLLIRKIDLIYLKQGLIIQH